MIGPGPAALLLGCCGLLLAACRGPVNDFRGVEAAERSVERSRPRAEAASAGTGTTVSGPAALVNGRPISWEALTPALAEAAGGTVLREVVLDLLLERELRQRGILISAGDLERERSLLVAVIAEEARADSRSAEELLEVVRRSRGLGEHRFGALLVRNAALRALVSGDVVVAREAIDREYLLRHGERFGVRVIMTPTHRAAAEARQRVMEAGGDARRVRFAEVAAEVSIDPSAERGGIVDPISPADPTYPASIREAVAMLNAGEVSEVLAVDRGFALLLMEERIAGDGVELGAVEVEIAESLRRREERLAMDTLAHRLLGEAEVSVMDRGLEWSWRAGRGR